MRRRRDPLEILRVKDVFTRQTLSERWLKVGTVSVVPDDNSLPTFYLAGVDDPMCLPTRAWPITLFRRERTRLSARGVSESCQR